MTTFRERRSHLSVKEERSFDWIILLYRKTDVLQEGGEAGES